MDNIIPVAVGGFLALFGGAVVQWLTHHFNARRERNKLIREKAEELCIQVDKLHEWVAARRRLKKDGQSLDGLDHPPLGRVIALARLYFPESDSELFDVGTKASLAGKTLDVALDALQRLNAHTEQSLSSGENYEQAHSVLSEEYGKLDEEAEHALIEFIRAGQVMIERISELAKQKTKH